MARRSPDTRHDFSLLFLIPMAVLVLFLLWFKENYDSSIETHLRWAAESFPAALLGSESTLPLIPEVEREAAKIESAYPEIEELVITRRFENGKTFVVYPPGRDSVPVGDIPGDAVIQAPQFSPEGDLVGDLYVIPNRWRLHIVQYSIWTVIILIMILMPLLLVRLVTARRRLVGAEDLLEEKTQQLIHLEKLSLVGMLTANIIHDLKKPVLHIRDELRVLDDSETKEQMNEDVDLFFRMLRELNLESLLRSTDDRTEYLDLEETVERSLNLVKYEMDGIEVEREGLDTLPLVLGVRHRLVQVFSNLALNAFQAMNGRGRLTVRGDTVEENGGTFARVSVTDTGRGIPPANLPRIFEPFFTSGEEEGSTGLGLYISKTIVEEMGGKITAESEVGKGTTFTVLVPAEKEEKEGKAPTE
jgi:signal transduction histidine kinase